MMRTAPMKKESRRTPWLGTVHFDLTELGYVDLEPPPGIDVAMIRKTLHELVHKVVAIVDCSRATPTSGEAVTLCHAFLDWSIPQRGLNGLALIVFVYAETDDATIRALLAPDRALQECPVERAVYDGRGQRYWYWQEMQGLLASHKAPA